MMNTKLGPRLQKLVDLGESGTDILHGELKNLAYEAEQSYIQGESEYYRGMLDAFIEVYALTYQLSFAISDRSKNAKLGI
jgi:hypothetical protein